MTHVQASARPPEPAAQEQRQADGGERHDAVDQLQLAVAERVAGTDRGEQEEPEPARRRRPPAGRPRASGPAIPARSCAAVACSTTSIPAITIARPTAVAIAMCSPSATLASAASAPSIAVTEATTEIAPRLIAAYDSARPALDPTPPTTIHAIACAGRPGGRALPDRHRQHEHEADDLHPGQRLQRTDQARRAVVARRPDAPRGRRAERGHDHEHQEMVPVVASTSTSAPTTTR